MPHIWMVHEVHKGGAWFADDESVIRSAARRGWVKADPPEPVLPKVRVAAPVEEKPPVVRVAEPKPVEQPVVRTGEAEPASPGGAKRARQGNPKKESE